MGYSTLASLATNIGTMWPSWPSKERSHLRNMAMQMTRKTTRVVRARGGEEMGVVVGVEVAGVAGVAEAVEEGGEDEEEGEEEDGIKEIGREGETSMMTEKVAVRIEITMAGRLKGLAGTLTMADTTGTAREAMTGTEIDTTIMMIKQGMREEEMIGTGTETDTTITMIKEGMREEEMHTIEERKTMGGKEERIKPPMSKRSPQQHQQIKRRRAREEKWPSKERKKWRRNAAVQGWAVGPFGVPDNNVLLVSL